MRMVLRSLAFFVAVTMVSAQENGAGAARTPESGPRGELASRRDGPGVEKLVKAVDAHAAGLAASDEFSGVILIARNGVPVFERAYGYADRGRKIPNTVETRFNLGSVNKAFTLLALDQLVGGGKLSLDDVIGKYLPDYPNPEAAKKVTIRQLTEMRSGIGDFFGDRYDAYPKERLRSLKDYLPLFADRPLEFEPGTKAQYSNGGYIVLGLIIEKVSGQDYFDYVREHIYQPAGMNSSGSFLKDSLPAECAHGYTREGNVWKPNDATLPERGSSAGGGYSTVHDLLRYATALEKGSITVPGVDERRGIGIFGGAPGLNSAIEWGNKTGYFIAVLSNFDPPAAQQMDKQIRAWAMEGPGALSRRPAR